MNLSRRTRAVVGLFSLALANACGPNLSAAHVKSAESATQAYSSGQYRQAAQHWAAAARTTTNKHHQDEANYRRASSLQRAGDLLAAQQLLVALKQKPGHRQARAAFDHAYLYLERVEKPRGFKLLEKALLAHPESGNAERALRRLLTHTTQIGGLQRGLDLLSRLEVALGGTGCWPRAGSSTSRPTSGRLPPSPSAARCPSSPSWRS